MGGGTAPGPRWPRLAAVPCCSPVFAVPAGAARQPRAAAGGWRQERRGDQKYLSGEMARDGDGGAAGTLHQGSGGQCAAQHHDTDYIIYTLFTIQNKRRVDNVDIDLRLKI